MKVEVTLKTKLSVEADSKLTLTVGAAETVASLKERVASSQMIPFPEQDLLLNGAALKDDVRLAQCGITDGAALEFVVKAADASLAKQLSELLQARDLSLDELGLLYCYKHGVSASQALKILGHEGKLQDFLKEQKSFIFENGRVALVREDSSLKPFSVKDEIAELLKANAGTMDIKDLNAKFAQKFNVSLSSLVGSRPIEFLSKETELFVVSGRSSVSLKSVLDEQATAKKEVQKPLPQETKEPISSPPGLEEDVEHAPWVPDNEQYLELHNRISSRSFNSKVVNILGDVVELVTSKLFFDIDHVVKGGSVGKGTAFTDCMDAEVVFFLKGLPPTRHDAWLPTLLKSVAGILSGHVDHCETVDDSVQVRLKDLSVDLRFSPHFETYADTIQALSQRGPDYRKYYVASLAKERTQFISRQPSHVKVTIRLLKWWRGQQDWSDKMMWPKDEILELMAVYSAVQTKPQDQRTAVSNVMSLFARFNEMRIVWSNYYNKDDVWAPLLRQRPLLMDPTNPFVNVADPQAFDASELMQLARSTHFFW